MSRQVMAATRPVPADETPCHLPVVGDRLRAKLVLNGCTDVEAETGRRPERLGQSILRMTDDHREGTAAFLAKCPGSGQGDGRAVARLGVALLHRRRTAIRE